MGGGIIILFERESPFSYQPLKDAVSWYTTIIRLYQVKNYVLYDYGFETLFYTLFYVKEEIYSYLMSMIIIEHMNLRPRAPMLYVWN